MAVAHRGGGWGTTGRVELSGGGASLQLRASWDATESTQLRGVLRLTPLGPDVEVGAEHRFNSITSGYVGTQVGLRSGVLLRVRCRRSKQTFEFPVLLSTDATEWQLFAASALLPPLLSLAMHRFVVRPLAKWRQSATARAARQEHAEALRAAHSKAAREAVLLLPVAKRRAAAEAAVDGLVILEAVFGDLEGWREAVAAGKVTSSCGAPVWPPPPPVEEEGEEGPSPSGRQEQQQPEIELVDDQQQQPSSSGAAAASSSAADADPDTEPPPPWLDVTAALQYLVAAGGLDLHPGVSKRGLMGFADVTSEGTEKRLYVGFFFNGALLEKEVGDLDMLRLPAAGQPVKDAAAAERLRGRLRAVVAGAGAAGAGGASVASSRRGSSVALRGSE